MNAIHLDLPEVQQIEIKNEVDRFGFSHFLAKQFGLSKPPRSFACFSHGWIWRRDLRLDDLGYYFTPLSTPIIVANSWQAQFMRKSGFATVVEGGLPFAYIPKSKIEKKKASLLIMPPHSIKYYGIGSDFYCNLIDYIKAIEAEFSEVCFCLHSDDANDAEINSVLRENGIPFIVGASASDANSLYRMRCIFDYFDYVTTIVMGSHILYAAFCGCKVSILDKYYFYYPQSALDQENVMNNVLDFKKRTLDLYNNKQKLIDQFPWLFVRNPGEALQMTNWASEEIGVMNLLSRDQLLELLGWSGFARVKAVNRILVRRILDVFK